MENKRKEMVKIFDKKFKIIVKKNSELIKITTNLHTLISNMKETYRKNHPDEVIFLELLHIFESDIHDILSEFSAISHRDLGNANQTINKLNIVSEVEKKANKKYQYQKEY